VKRRTDGEPPTPATRPPRVIVPDLVAHRGSSGEILLREEERDHVRSRRLRDGDEVVVLDGKGARARAHLTRRGTALTLLGFEELSGALPGEPSRRVTVLLACAEPARIEWAVEKGTECGAARFVLLEAARSQRAHVVALRSRLPRLRRIAAEATKQCGRTIVPEIEGPEEIEVLLRKEECPGRARRPLLLAEPSGERIGAPDSRPDLVRPGGEITLAVGPEGGFTLSEISLFEGFGAVPVSLGPRVLRLETAVVAALTLLVGTE